MCFLVQGNLQNVEQTTTQQQQQDYRSSPPTPDEVQWSYTDPQGKVQGKSASSRNKKFILLNFFLPRISRKGKDSVISISEKLEIKYVTS